MRHQRSPSGFNRSKIQMQGCRGGILTTLPPLCLDMNLTCWFKLDSFSLNLGFALWNMIVIEAWLHLETVWTVPSFSLSAGTFVLPATIICHQSPGCCSKTVSSALATVTLSRAPARGGNCWFVASVGLDCVSCSRKMWVKTVRSLQKDSVALGMTADNCI